jgi:hypothetical protein
MFFLLGRLGRILARKAARAAGVSIDVVQEKSGEATVYIGVGG